MTFIRLILIFWALILPALAGQAAKPLAIQPVFVQGDHVTIVHDGATSYYDPHTEAGRKAITESRGMCCVQAPEHWHGRAQGFALKGDPESQLPHESMRFVINPHTGAFIATTTLTDSKYEATDPRHYVDADMTPMVSLTPEQVEMCGCKIGDRVLLTDITNHQTAWAVYGSNAGPQAEDLGFIGISLGAAAALHIPVNYVTQDVMQATHKVSMSLYPGSGYGGRFPHGPIPAVTANIK